MKKIKNQNGSITLFVLISCLFFITFLTSMFILSAVKRQSQIQYSQKTEEIYESGNQGEIYQEYFGEGAVPIYTKEQLDKICSGEQIPIKEEGGKIYTFSSNSVYILKNDISFEYNGIWQLPNYFGETGRIEGQDKQIIVKDTSKTDEVYYYYLKDNNYKFPLRKKEYGAMWQMVLYQNNKAGTILFEGEEEALNYNSTDKYSTLWQLEKYRREDGKFEFLLEYGGISGYNRWKQTSNPCATLEKVENYEPVEVSWTAGGFYGLGKSSSGSCLLDGQVGDTWWYSVGTYSSYHNGAPGPYDDVITETLLWVGISN